MHVAINHNQKELFVFEQSLMRQSIFNSWGSKAKNSIDL